MSWDIKVEGLAPIVRTLARYPQELDGIVRPALKAGGTVIVGHQRQVVHKVTRKLAQAIGMTEQGHGAGVTVTVGLQPGLGTPRGYSEAATARWKTPRKGINKGDPQDYGKYEEARHPFFLQVYVKHRAEVEQVITARASAEMTKRLRP